MDYCPAEIWEYIFQYACTDGGTTGLALSRVSRLVRSLSSPVKFYTLILSNLNVLASFCAFLESGLYSHDKQSIRHLFLAITNEHGDSSEQCTKMYLLLLRTLGPGLRGFTFLAPFSMTIPASLRQHLIFPRLEELVVISNNPDLFYLICATEHSWKTLPSFPKLKRAKLHFRGAMFKELFHTLVTDAPSLSRLEIVQPHIIRTSDLLIALKLFYGIGASSATRSSAGEGGPHSGFTIELETIRELLVGGLSWLHERFALEQIAAQDDRLRIKPQRSTWSIEVLTKAWLDGKP